MLLKKFKKFYEENTNDFNNALVQLKIFNEKYGKSYVENMTLENYCLGFGKKENYCNMLETETQSLGSVKGGTSLKYGVYYSKSNDNYVMTTHFENEDKVLENIKEMILEIIQTNNIQHLINLYRYKVVGETIRNKISYLYHPTKLIPIFSKNKVLEIYEYFGIEPPKDKDYYSLNTYLKEFLTNKIKDYNTIVENEEIGNIALMYFLYSNIFGIKNSESHNKESLKSQIPLKFYYNDFVSSDLEGYSILLSKKEWNDYGNEITYKVVIIDKYSYNNISYEIGTTKIMNIDGSMPIFESGIIPDEELKNIVSLSLDKDYYGKIKEVVGKELAEIILEKLNDLITKNYSFIKKLEQYDIFKNGLIRGYSTGYINYCKTRFYELETLDDSKKLSYPIGNLDLVINYLQSKSRLKFNLDFQYDTFGLNRINALIGKNGIGKTTSLQKIAYLLSDNERKYNILSSGDSLQFQHYTDDRKINNPFRNIIGISYGVFGKKDEEYYQQNENEDYSGGFEFLNNSENGIYCNNKDLLSEKILKLKDNGVVQESGYSYKVINQNSLTNHNIKKLINTFTIEEFKNIDINFLLENPKKADELSSGTKVIISTVIDVIQNIKPESLIIIDEPETHLHPEYASILIKIFYNLLEEFDSYMIIGTHSPTIIQQIPSRYVIKLYSDQDNKVHACRLSIESFGNNLTDITYDVFGGDRTTTHYKEHIIKLKKNGRSKKEIIDFFEDSKIPLSLRLFIEQTYHEEN